MICQFQEGFSLFENIVTKIKLAAKVLMILGVFGSFGAFVVVLMKVSLPFGIFSLIFGIILTWILSCLVYGFGERVESARIFANAYAKSCNSAQPSESRRNESCRNH